MGTKESLCCESFLQSLQIKEKNEGSRSKLKREKGFEGRARGFQTPDVEDETVDPELLLLLFCSCLFDTSLRTYSNTRCFSGLVTSTFSGLQGGWMVTSLKTTMSLPLQQTCSPVNILASHMQRLRASSLTFAFRALTKRFFCSTSLRTLLLNCGDWKRRRKEEEESLARWVRG